MGMELCCRDGCKRSGWLISLCLDVVIGSEAKIKTQKCNCDNLLNYSCALIDSELVDILRFSDLSRMYFTQTNSINDSQDVVSFKSSPYYYLHFQPRSTDEHVLLYYQIDLIPSNHVQQSHTDFLSLHSNTLQLTQLHTIKTHNTQSKLTQQTSDIDYE